MPNQELFRKIYDQITQHPETHDQSEWEAGEDCVTTRCVAGWALHFHNPNQPLFETARKLVGYSSVEDSARKVLGLNEVQALRLFHGTSNEEAVELVRHYAGIED